MNEADLRRIIAAGESAAVEFKSDRNALSDNDLVDAVVCLANYRGGTIFLGIEDDGRVTGLHPNHQSNPAAMVSLIAARTVPSQAVRVEVVELPEGKVAAVAVPVARQPIATAGGKVLIRFEDTRGRPGCHPLYPYELMSWRAERGQVDYSALSVTGATWDDLDTLEFARLRRFIEEYRGDAALMELSDPEIARALGLIVDDGGQSSPTITGLLLVGKEAALRQYLPTHEIAFQALRGLDVTVNEFRRWPLLRAHEWLMQAIEVRNEEQELMSGAVRVGIPRYYRLGLREAIHNALIHRDYTHIGAVHVQLHDDYVQISSPGGFVPGVHPSNILSASPRPRNPLLADVFKRIGLVERTGRGVSLIYLGQLQNGRRPPNYDRSTESGVTVLLDNSLADLDFVRLALQANQRIGRALQMQELAALWLARRGEASPVADLTGLIQQNAGEILERLAASELVVIDAGVYRLTLALGGKPAIETKPVASLEETILAYVAEHGQITRREAAEVGGVTEVQASYLLRKLVISNILMLIGKGHYAHYVIQK
jgi:ATP-dependent DNA helicase RecG